MKFKKTNSVFMVIQGDMYRIKYLLIEDMYFKFGLDGFITKKKH